MSELDPNALLTLLRTSFEKMGKIVPADDSLKAMAVNMMGFLDQMGGAEKASSNDLSAMALLGACTNGFSNKGMMGQMLAAARIGMKIYGLLKEEGESPQVMEEARQELKAAEADAQSKKPEKSDEASAQQQFDSKAADATAQVKAVDGDAAKDMSKQIETLDKQTKDSPTQPKPGKEAKAEEKLDQGSKPKADQATPGGDMGGAGGGAPTMSMGGG